MTDPNRMFSLFELPPEGAIWEWAEQSIIIPARIPTNYPGAYRSDIAIYTRDFLDMIKAPNVKTIIIEKGAQTGLTQAAYIALAYWCAVDPGPCLVVYPSEDIARSMSEIRIMPMFEESPALAALIPHDRKTRWTKLQYNLRKNVVNFVGSNSPAQVGSRPIRYAITDEEDKFPRQIKQEADTVELVGQRLKTYKERARWLRISTPTTSTGHIHRAYLSGDRRRLFLPCPKCGMMQILVWAQVRFDSSKPVDESARGAFYECANPKCKMHIMDGHKPGMLAKREWRATAVSSDPATVSLHLSSLYAPWVSWAQLVRKFLMTRTNPEQLQDFINSELGEPFDKADARVDSDSFAEREGAYEEDQVWLTVPPYSAAHEKAENRVDYHTLIWSDVQKGYLVAVARVFTNDGDSGLLWSGTLSGFDALDALADKLNAEAIALDRRYRGEEVMEWVYANRTNGYLVTIGVTRKGGTLYDGHALNIDEGKRGGKHRGQVRQIYELAIDPNKAKDILAKCIEGDKSAPKWMIPAGYSRNREYVEQMTSEQSIAGKWEKIGDRQNHFWDAESNLLAMAIKMGFWKWRNDRRDQDEAE
jgi:phage terminase large subunit GpA-like protein